VKTQRGFTLVELLIATAITGILAGVLSPIIFQLTNVTEYGNDRSLALHELQNAASWFNYDGQMAASAAGASTLTFTLPSAATVIYYLSGTTLNRTAGATVTPLAQNISNLSFTVNGSLVTMSITSSPPGRMNISEQSSYVVYLRPSP